MINITCNNIKITCNKIKVAYNSSEAPQVCGVPAESCVQGAEYDGQTMIYRRFIVVIHISYHLISSHYHQGTTGRTL